VTTPEAAEARLTQIWLLNATATSGGNGPGAVRVPPAEAHWLVAGRLAIYGDRPPLDGTEQAEAALRRAGPWMEEA